jgi:muconolactone delta-isomerase
MSDNHQLYNYMVEFAVPVPFPTELYHKIPDQQEMVQKLFSSGKLASYTLASDLSKLWAVFVCSSESELLNYIDKLPLSKYMEFDYSELRFHQSLKLLPSMSMN